MDFGEINNLLEKKGIPSVTLRYQNCGGPITPPKTGTTATCPYCNYSVHIQDVLNDIMEFMQKLEF